MSFKFSCYLKDMMGLKHLKFRSSEWNICTFTSSQWNGRNTDVNWVFKHLLIRAMRGERREDSSMANPSSVVKVVLARAPTMKFVSPRSISAVEKNEGISCSSGFCRNLLGMRDRGLWRPLCWDFFKLP